MPEIQLDIVSAERALFSDKVRRLSVSGEQGELGIEPGHTALLTRLKPGAVECLHLSGEEESFYISGGILEVQPNCVTILADTAIRAPDLDEAAAEAAQRAAESQLSNSDAKIDYATALSDLAQASAQLRLIRKLRGKG